MIASGNAFRGAAPPVFVLIRGMTLQNPPPANPHQLTLPTHPPIHANTPLPALIFLFCQLLRKQQLLHTRMGDVLTGYAEVKFCTLHVDSQRHPYK